MINDIAMLVLVISVLIACGIFFIFYAFGHIKIAYRNISSEDKYYSSDYSYR